MWAPFRRDFFDARPVGLQPRGDRSGVALARHAFRLLGGETSLAKPGAQVSRIEPDAELLADELAQAGCRPELGGQAVVRRAVGQPA